MFNYLKRLFNRPKRERGVSRIQDMMLTEAIISDQLYYIPFLHTPWLYYFGLHRKPLARLIKDGYLVRARWAGWYSLTLKGIEYLDEDIRNEGGNYHVTFGQYEPYDWTTLFSKIEVNNPVGIHEVKVGP